MRKLAKLEIMQAGDVAANPIGYGWIGHCAGELTGETECCVMRPSEQSAVEQLVEAARWVLVDGRTMLRAGNITHPEILRHQAELDVAIAAVEKEGQGCA
jgi:hypothetical protein